jgi:hypothetical protein
MTTFKFNTKSVAQDFIDRSTTPSKFTIVEGKNGLFLVVTLRQALRNQY